MSKQTFIRATEIWTPTADGKHLDLTAGIYGELTYFEAVSRGMRFAYDEGLPGRTWAAGQPIILKNLTNSYFQRGESAASEGLSCAVSLPVFAKGELTAVVVFFCGDDRFHVGALEVWNAAAGETEMKLVDGYFGRAQRFEFTSRHTSFPRKMGLPGKVWETGKPVIMEDLGRGNLFLRRDAAEKIGINRAVGFPCTLPDAGNWVMTFLSAKNTPIARRFECWTPNDDTGEYRFEAGFCESGTPLEQCYENTVLPLDYGPFARANSTGIPVICTDIGKEEGPIAQSSAEASLSSMVAMPIFEGDRLNAVLAWFL